ncbi:TPA: hypothetical protein NID03_001844 [Pseudomonas aeruginosa]|nr:hypothetical protein [Pseudomonas aeruginosa]
MTDHAELRRLAALAHPDAEWFIARNLDHPNIDKPAASFIAAATPKTVLGLIDEVERLEEELSQCASALPGTYYMDPPDGGNVSIPEQIRRMAKDAARYRWLIASAWYVGPEPKGDTEAVSWHDHNDTMHGVTTAIDAAIEGAKQ